ncbi:major capsid protein E [Rhodopseudomonas faecalis]|uniref:Major capsid protein E n=1 Tax=Rhodopseudomonas faecalis TaxID=99655 RepID=A0A318TKU6_9BRAD|nr:major capsid protein [Rhodopseudomonas faecalis]PYF05033.1 major capsid protein E [Rhodopseudomonas faecalis]
MPEILDVFAGDAFSFMSLTASINKIPFVPGRLGSFGLFNEIPVPTTKIAIEEVAGQLSLVAPSPRGGPGETRPKLGRNARTLNVPHYQLDDNILADEVQNVREAGLNMGMRTVDTYLSGRMSLFTANLDATLEHQRVGAIKGLILDRDGNTIYDLFSEFGVQAEAPVNFALTTGTTKVRSKCTQVVRTLAKNLGGVGFNGVIGMAGDDFWDTLIDHDEVRETYKYQEGRALRDGVAFQTLNYGGITFENYKGWVGGFDGSPVVPFIEPNECRFFPVGVPNLFQTYFAPADYQETVNTLGLPRYAKSIPSDNGKSTRLEMQTNPLSICTRPRVLMRGKASA